MLKIAMIVRSTLFTVRGGDTIQVMETARHLNKNDVSVTVKLTHEKIDYSQFDLLHFFNITRPADIICHINRSNKPFVVSPIFIDYAEFDKLHRTGFSGILFRYLPKNSIEYLKTITRWLLQKDSLISKSYIWNGQKRSIISVLEKAALFLPNSSSEYSRLEAAYHCKNGYRVIPNAIDPEVFKQNQTIPKDPDLVLCVARIEGIKNQLTLIKALNNTRFQLVIIGSASPNQQSYYAKCRKLAASNIQFIDHLPQSELVDFYQKAKVHVLPSWFETTGLSSLEAAAMGCQIVITDKGDTREYFNDQAFYCNPQSPTSIYAAIEAASASTGNPTLQNKILSSFTWNEATLHTLHAYESIKNLWA